MPYFYPFFIIKTRVVSIRKFRMRNYLFSIRKRAIFSHGQEIKGLRGGVHRYAAQAGLKIDAAMAEKGRFRMKTRVESTMDNCYSFPAHYYCDIVMVSFREAFRGDLGCTVTR
jgi:hypothetical protein